MLVRWVLEVVAYGMLTFIFVATLFYSDPVKRFERDGFEYGRGGITLGCAFSYHLPPEPYSVDNPSIGLLLLTVQGDNEQLPSLRTIVDGPFGLTVLIGEGCKASIDWTYFPLKE